MENHKLRIKIGEHEFEAEGSREVVQKQFEEFKELVRLPDIVAKQPQTSGVRLKSRKGHQEMPALADVAEKALTPEQEAVLARLGKIIHCDRKTRLISLTVLPQGEKKQADAVLLLLLGYKRFRGDDLVPVTAINKGLELSGCGVDRLDRVMNGYIKDNLVTKVGLGKGGKYRFTNPGLQRAEEIVEDLLKIVVG